MARKKAAQPKIIANRRARFDYVLQDELRAGLSLTGPEVRAARDGRVSLTGSYVTTKGGELWLTNASFSLPATSGSHEKVVDTSSRKLLVKHSELTHLIAAKNQGLTIIPLRLQTGGRFIKVIIAAAKGKKQHDKREVIKKRDTEREARRFIKQQ